jgi:hypothetical protein
MKPRARTHALVSYKVADETVVYNLETHQAHCLSPLAALVWRLSDGERSVREIAATVAAELGSVADRRSVVAALRQLAAADLLVADDAGAASSYPGRRGVLKSLAAAGAVAAGAFVTTIVVPRAAAALSCAAFHEPCQQDSDCCSGRCRGGKCQRPHGHGGETGWLGAGCARPGEGLSGLAEPGSAQETGRR